MSDNYFSDRELGLKPRIEEQITPRLWRSIVSVIESLAKKGAFGMDFPENCCSDGDWTTGTDRNAFLLAAQAEIPDIDFSLQTVENVDELTRECTVLEDVP